jgi:hypothetical protein
MKGVVEQTNDILSSNAGMDTACPFCGGSRQRLIQTYVLSKFSPVLFSTFYLTLLTPQLWVALHPHHRSVFPKTSSNLSEARYSSKDRLVSSKH